MMAAVAEGTMGLDVLGMLYVEPINYKFLSGNEMETQPISAQSYGQTLPIMVTPQAAYKNTRIKILVRLLGKASDVYLRVSINVG